MNQMSRGNFNIFLTSNNPYSAIPNVGKSHKSETLPHRTKKKFTKEEDEKLQELVEKYGCHEWTQVSKELIGRNARQCRDRWNNYLTPNNNYSAWTQEEDITLLHHHSNIGNRWSVLSSFFPKRTKVSVRNRFYRIQNQTDKKQIQNTQFQNEF